MNYINRDVVITGGLGFIGSSLAKKLVEQGAIVHLVDNLNPNFGGNYHNISEIKDKVKVHILDISDKEAMTPIILKSDFLFHLAGQTSHLDSMIDPINDLIVNAQATLTLLEICRLNPKIRFVFTSSRQLYGKPQYLPVDEKHTLSPPDINGIHKYAAEQYINLYHQCYGLSSTILRLTNTYGPGLRIKDSKQMFLGHWFRHVIENKPFEVWGGEQLRDLAFVDDVCDALLRVAVNEQSIGKTFNVGGAEPIKLVDLAQLLIDTADQGEFVLKDYPENRKNIDIGSIYLNDQKIRDTTGWYPKVELAEGLKHCLSYYRHCYQEYL